MFSENSDVSCMRVMSFLALLAAIFLALTGHESSVVPFLTAAFGGKLSQKFVEQKDQ